MNKKIFTIDATGAGVRADKFLAENMPEFSRAEIQRMEKNVENSRKLKPGDIIEIAIPIDNPQTSNHEPRATNHESRSTIIYEDDDIVVVNKPRGMVMYPAAGNIAGTLVQELLGHRGLSELGGDARPGVVHRIDKDTSGVVILAKSDAAFRALAKTFSDHDLVRKYIAFVWGIPTWTSADIEGNIARNSRNRKKMSMVKSGGKPAKTMADVINAWPRAEVSELRCQLFTGRTHQIRVHLSAHGFPVLTDPTYGRGRETKIRPSELLDFLRGHSGQCLHAEVLELAHPITGAPLKFRAPLPDDLQELKELLNNYS
jgi:23S rRNA pseudouridine1911/1915/1917 synthase